MREEIKFVPANTEFKQIVKNHIQIIEKQLENNENVDEAILAFNLLVGKDYDRYYFEYYYSFESLDDFVEKASCPSAFKVENLSREELIEIIKELLEAINSFQLAKENYYEELLERNLSCPYISDLISCPSRYGIEDNDESLIEKIVDIALAYKPICL